MKLSRTATYAVQAALQLAQNPTKAPIPCSRMASQDQMPERFLLQILRSLVTHGILQSSRGVEGGYTLERDPRQITLLDLIEAVDGPITAGLPLGDKLPDACRGVLSESLRAITAETRAQLQAVTLAMLLPPPAAPPTPASAVQPPHRSTAAPADFL